MDPQVNRSALYMELPYDMDPAELAAYCRAQLDPAEKQAIREWARERFGSFPTVLNGGLKARPRAPSHDTTNSANTAIGIPSPSASEHDESVVMPVINAARHPQPPAATSEALAERPSSLKSTPQKASRRAPVSRLSKSSRDDRKSRKMNMRATRSSSQASESAVETDQSGAEVVLGKALSTKTQASCSGQPEGSLSLRSASLPKRKRNHVEDDDNEPEEKRSRTESRPGASDTGIAFGATPTLDDRTYYNEISHIEGWLCGQGPDYEPLESPQFKPDGDRPPPNVKLEAENSGSYKQAFTTKLDSPQLATSHSAMTAKPAPSSYVDKASSAQPINCLPRETSSLCPTQTPSKSEPIQKQTPLLGSQSAPLSGSRLAGCISENPNGKKKKKERQDVLKLEVKTLECAYEVTRAYCRALGLKRNIINYANILLHDVFFDEEFKDRPAHALITGCIAIACSEKNSPQKWPDIFALTNESRFECGKTMMKLCPKFIPMTPKSIHQMERPSINT